MKILPDQTWRFYKSIFQKVSMLYTDLVMAYFGVFCHQKLINCYEKYHERPLRVYTTILAFIWVFVHQELAINQNLKPNNGKIKVNITEIREFIIHLIHLNSLIRSKHFLLSGWQLRIQTISILWSVCVETHKTHFCRSSRRK